MTKITPLLILDIDGTVREGKDDALGKFVNKPEDVRVFREAIVRMLEHRDQGGRILGISNQGGIEQGYVTEDDIVANMRETNVQAATSFDEILWCPHYTNYTDPFPSCWCRKPSTLLAHMGIEMFKGCWPNENYRPDHTLFVGDRPEDEECARRLSVRFKWAKDWRTGQ